MAIGDFRWLSEIGGASAAHFFALAMVIISLPSLAILTAREARGARGRPFRLRVVLASLFLFWSIPILVTVLAAALWGEIAFVLPFLERAVFALSILVIGWAYLTVDLPSGSDHSRVFLYVIALGIIALAFVSAGYWVQEAPAAAVFAGSIYEALWSLVLLGVSASGLLICLLQLGKIPQFGGKLLFFGILTLTQALALAFNFRGVLSLGEIATISRLGWLLALLTLPTLVARSTFPWLARDLSPELASGAMGPLTAEWSAWQAVRAALTGEDRMSLPRTILQAATRASHSDFALLLRAPRANAAGEMLYAEVLDVYDARGLRATPLIALSLAGLPQIAAALQEGEMRILAADIDSVELAALYRQLDRAGRGPTLLFPLPRANAAILLVAPQAAGRYSERQWEVSHQLAEIADGLLERAVAPPQESLPSGDIPTRDEALANAREHILQLTAQLAQFLDAPAVARESANPLSQWDEGAREELRRENETLQRERDQLAERSQEWEDALRVLGLEGGAQGLWDYLVAEKERLSRAYAEIEQLQRERAEGRNPGAGQETVAEALPAPRIAPDLPKRLAPNLADVSLDILPVIEKSLAASAPRMRERGIHLELALESNLPRAALDFDNLQTALATMIEYLLISAPSGGKLCLAARPEAGRLQLEISLPGARAIPVGVLSTVQVQLENSGVLLRHERVPVAGEPLRLGTYIFTLPVATADTRAPKTRAAIGSWRSAL